MNYLYFIIEGIFPYLALTIFIAGTIYQLWRWFQIPVPLRISLAPAKTTWQGVAIKVTSEVVLFLSLFRTDRTFWIVAWIMHICGLAILIGSHTFGVIAEFVNYHYLYTIPLARTIPAIAALFSFPLIASLLYLLLKRIIIKEIKRISFPVDYFALGLILFHVIDGVYMTYFTKFDLQEGVKWGVGLITFRPYIIQDSWIFAVHCLTGFSLFLYFPFSKLFHPLGQIANRMTMTQKEELLIKGGSVVK
jgi:nitrate reductase gamma subunit